MGNREQVNHTPLRPLPFAPRDTLPCAHLGPLPAHTPRGDPSLPPLAPPSSHTPLSQPLPHHHKLVTTRCSACPSPPPHPTSRPSIQKNTTPTVVTVAHLHHLVDRHRVAPHALLMLAYAAVPAVVAAHVAELADAPVVDRLPKEALRDRVRVTEQRLLQLAVALVGGLLKDACGGVVPSTGWRKGGTQRQRFRWGFGFWPPLSASKGGGGTQRQRIRCAKAIFQRRGWQGGGQRQVWGWLAGASCRGSGPCWCWCYGFAR